MRRKKTIKPESRIARINAAARERGLDYGDYVGLVKQEIDWNKAKKKRKGK